MKYFLYLILVVCFVACGESDTNQNNYKKDLKEFRKFRNKKMSSLNSPIPSAERKSFVGLNFYPANQTFYFKANFTLIFAQQIMEMKTNTDRNPKFLPYGEINFKYQDKNYVLIAYKSLDDPSDDLFVPFTDLSCGKGSYETGRYLDIETPKNDSIILDFNKCYNPYCAYNANYSCPIPPIENNLPISIEAGERNFHN